MSNYQLHLLLEALVKVHSIRELSDGSKAIARLVQHLRVSWDEAEAIAEGALFNKFERLGVCRVSSAEGGLKFKRLRVV